MRYTLEEDDVCWTMVVGKDGVQMIWNIMGVSGINMMGKVDGYEHEGFICATTLFLTINKCKALFVSIGKKF